MLVASGASLNAMIAAARWFIAKEPRSSLSQRASSLRRGQRFYERDRQIERACDRVHQSRGAHHGRASRRVTAPAPRAQPKLQARVGCTQPRARRIGGCHRDGQRHQHAAAVWLAPLAPGFSCAGPTGICAFTLHGAAAGVHRALSARDSMCAAPAPPARSGGGTIAIGIARTRLRGPVDDATLRGVLTALRSQT
jgi:hypothetical protein